LTKNSPSLIIQLGSLVFNLIVKRIETMKKRLFFPLLLPLIFITACGVDKTKTSPMPTPMVTEEITVLPETEAVVQTEVPESQVPDSQVPSTQPAEPQSVSFSAQDGQTLQGKFYPASLKSAPVIVLMHWYPGDQDEWTEIAYWLQNRGFSGDQNGVPWKDPSWFPSLDADTSFNILTFTFRNCEGRCNSPDLDGWLLDARASLEYARTLEGVDPDRVIAIGASIGADGAIDGCAAVLETDPDACLGALSLSPGNYLGPPYPDMVTALGANDPPRPAWCLFDKNEADSVVCSQASGDNYYQESWNDGNLHGFHLLTPNLEPRPLDRIPQFLDLVLGN
jgi:hypothetical protein